MTTSARGRVGAEVDDVGVAHLVLDNADRHNAITSAMRVSVIELLRAWAEDPAVRVVLVSGAGNRSFCSGLDLSEEADRSHEDLAADLALFWRSWEGFPKPVVAAIGGHCIGGGVLTALQADVRYCSDAASFSIPAARLGLPFGFDSSRQLFAELGRAWASEMVFTARRLTAQEALTAGLVSRVVPSGELMREARAAAGEMAVNAPLTIRAAKAALQEASRDARDRDLERVERLVVAARESSDLREGLAARTERRLPHFSGD